ncbi:MAG: hypothetical protein ACFFBP_07805 [Promethearchaeota archaeon]
MFRNIKTQFKFKTYKSDAAPFFFFIDIYPLKLNNFDKPRSSFLAQQIQNKPIIPLPMRVDKVFNGEHSLIIHPDDPITFPINDSNLAIIDPFPFLQLGLEKLIYFTEIRSQETFFLSLKQKAVEQWWNATKNFYGNMSQLEEDFTAFLKAYLHTMLNAYINEEDLVGAAIDYCTIINDICKERMLRNLITVEIDTQQLQHKLFQEKTRKYREKLKTFNKTEFHPELIDIEVFNLSETDFKCLGTIKDEIRKDYDNFDVKILKYIPLLLYDDLQECMLQNLKLLETNEYKLQNPSILLESKIIKLERQGDLSDFELINRFNWLNNLRKIDINSLFNSLTEALNQLNNNKIVK